MMHIPEHQHLGGGGRGTVSVHNKFVAKHETLSPKGRKLAGP